MRPRDCKDLSHEGASAAACSSLLADVTVSCQQQSHRRAQYELLLLFGVDSFAHTLSACRGM